MQPELLKDPASHGRKGQQGRSKYVPPCSSLPKELTAHTSDSGSFCVPVKVPTWPSKELRWHSAHVTCEQPASQSYQLAEEALPGACEDRGFSVSPLPGNSWDAKAFNRQFWAGPKDTSLDVLSSPCPLQVLLLARNRQNLALKMRSVLNQSDLNTEGDRDVEEFVTDGR